MESYEKASDVALKVITTRTSENVIELDALTKKRALLVKTRDEMLAYYNADIASVDALIAEAGSLGVQSATAIREAAEAARLAEIKERDAAAKEAEALAALEENTQP